MANKINELYTVLQQFLQQNRENIHYSSFLLNVYNKLIDNSS